LNFAIGQGQVVTPIQLANYTAGLGNGYVLYRPHLRLYSPDSAGGKGAAPVDTLDRIRLQDATRTMIREALKAVMEPGGTGGWARVPGVNVGGKTGTAQNPQGEDHALFIAVAPLEAPRIAVAVVVENAGHGGSVAAPIAGKILRTFFGQ
jgi:penicillin-binding protein 2